MREITIDTKTFSYRFLNFFIQVNVDEDKVITLKEQDWLDYLFDLMSDGLNLDPDWLSQGRPGSNITKLFRSVIY